MLIIFLFSLFALNGLVHSRCIDGENNVIKVADTDPNTLIHTSDVTFKVYDKDKQPSCYKNQANLVIPGYITLASMTINVTKELNLIGNSKTLLTLRKNDFLIGYICNNGKAHHLGVLDKFCTSDLCHGDSKVCKLFEKPGVYDVNDIKNALDSPDGTFYLDDHAHNITSLILKGQWKGSAQLKSGDQVVANIKGPSDTKWLWADE